VILAIYNRKEGESQVAGSRFGDVTQRNRTAPTRIWAMQVGGLLVIAKGAGTAAVPAPFVCLCRDCALLAIYLASGRS